MPPDVFVLDDGFQHVQLARACDIVLVDATNPFGGGRMLPAGFLREPLRNLRRAHIFVITRSDEVNDLAPLRARLQSLNPNAPIFTARHAFAGIRNLATGENVAVKTLTDQRLLAVCGLANPASFHRLLATLNLTATKRLDFPDHHWFSKHDIEYIQQTLASENLDAFITTEKDEARLRMITARMNRPLYVVTIAISVEPYADFEDRLLQIFSDQF